MKHFLSRFLPQRSIPVPPQPVRPALPPVDFSQKTLATLKTKQDIYAWIKKGIASYQEWYQPVDFGNGVIAYETRPPDWKPIPDSLTDIGGGTAKWNYIIKKHLPDLRGKRVLDVGCSVGVMSLACARAGAAEVIGIDRDEHVSYHSTTSLPPQNIQQQALFVKTAFELLDKKTYPIRYIAQDVGTIEKLELGRFDCILALCIVYHELDRTPDLVKKLSDMTDYLVLQANQVHTGPIGTYSDKMYLATLLSQNGFTSIEIDAPDGYMLPVIVGKKGAAVR